MSVFIKYEYREILRVRFSGQYGKRAKLTRRQTIVIAMNTRRAKVKRMKTR